MAIFHFTGEIICELTGQYLDFELEYDVYEDPDMTRQELIQMGQDYASFADQEVLNYIMDNLSVVLNFEHVETDDDD
jgi:hypothetical protein